MTDTILKRVLEKSIERELAEYDNAPEHKFSLKHRLAMKMIFKRYEKNSRKTIELFSATMPRYGLKQKVILALVIVILMTLLTGWFFPLHRITEPQINWLRSRYDFPNMKINIPPSDAALISYPGGEIAGLWRVNDDYINFLYDLEQLGIYTSEETYALLDQHRPIDNRPVNLQNGIMTISEGINLTDHIAKQIAETPLSTTREFVSDLEKQIKYYTERSKDKARAVEGDAEFAADIRDNYLPLHKGYLALLEKLYAERSDDESSETLNNVLLVLDKDDRRYLFKINEFEKC